MRRRLLRTALATACLLGLPAFTTTLVAQTLSEQLKAEPAVELAKAAREKGNAIRGAILFAEQKQGCANCHAAGNNQLLGPDLTRLGQDTTDQSIVESLLEPSRVIRKGYETTTVVTRDGKTLSGRILERSPDKIVLRENSADRLLRTLPVSEIDEIAVSPVSSMPDKLIDQLKERQQFLDLVRYVMEISATGAETTPSRWTATGGATVRTELQGLVLINDFQCGACHQDGSTSQPLTTRHAPRLDWSAGHLDPAYIKSFLSAPHAVKPGSTMPDVLATLPSAERSRVVNELTHYIVSRSETRFERQPIDHNSAASGRELFHAVGCVACHSPRSQAGDELLPESSVPLGDLRAKYSVLSLQEFLKDPHRVRPSGRMPNMQLTHWEALDIAHYLAGKEPDQSTDQSAFKSSPQLAEAGRAHFQKYGCVACHEPDAKPTFATSKPLSQLALNQGCLDPDDERSPRFELNDSQRASIRAALSEPVSLTDEDQIDLTLTAFRCVNCHQRNELGGVSDERNHHFHTTNENLGRQGRIPPTLTGVGAKLKPVWMRQVLVSGRAIRPYMQTRMPQFGTEQVEHLVDLFQEVDELPAIEFAKFDDQKLMRETGFELAGRDGLNCIACHTFQLKPAATMPAVDLTEMSERLHKTWFYRYMRSPQQLSLNTVMPSFWPGGRAIRQDVLDGQPDMQIEALWQYLLDGRQARAPKGLVVEPIELLATDEAVMLRRSYPGIGKRGIGVGYPRELNLAFDAEQMRLATLWKGPFADPGGVWRSQGHGMVRPLSRELIQFDKGPDLDDADAPWIVDDGRPPAHQFQGYSLDSLQRPRFRYRFDSITVEDYARDVLDESTGQPVLLRTLTLQSSAPRPHTVFRAATGKKIEAIDDSTYLIDGRLKVRIGRRQQAEVVATETGQVLRIPLTVPAGTSTLVIEYLW